MSGLADWLSFYNTNYISSVGMGSDQRCTTDKYLVGVNDSEARLVIYIWSKIETSGKLNPRGENNDEGKEPLDRLIYPRGYCLPISPPGNKVFSTVVSLG